MTETPMKRLIRENTEILDYLKKARLFGHLDEDLLKKLVPLSEVVRYSKGSVVLKEGQVNDRVFVVIQGIVSIYVENEHILTLRRVGDIFGEMSIIDDKPCNATVVADTEVQLFSLQARNVGRYTDIQPKEIQNILYRLFSKVLSEKLSLTTFKAKQYEIRNRQLDEAQTILFQAHEELGTQMRELQATTISKNFFNNVIQSMMGSLVVLSAEGTIKMVNQGTLDMLGYEEEELMGQPMQTILAAEEFFQEASLDDLKAVGLVMNVEAHYLTKDGQHIPMLFAASVMYDENQQEQGMVCVALDITERKKAEAEQNKLELQLRHTQKIEAIGVLAGGIAHEFNNILQGMLNYAELSALRIPESNPARQYLRQVLQLGERAGNLIQQILTYSRQETQKLDRIRLIPIIEDTLQMMRATLPVTIEIHQHFDVSEDTILGNSGQIHQVLVNLCTNAGYAMREKNGKLEVFLADLTPEDREGWNDFSADREYLKLSVKDNGTGMPADIMTHIFDPFFTTKPVGEGSGMGLPVVHGIVDYHDGSIHCWSEPDIGTRFDVFFPKVEFNEDGIERGLSLSDKKHRVLFVDDEEMLVEVAKATLNELGCDVVVASNPISALEIFHTNPLAFDLVITDQTMPEMTGIQLGGNLMKLRPDIPVVLVTGFSELVNLDVAHSLGFRKFILKPLTHDRLQAMIAEVLGK